MYRVGKFVALIGLPALGALYFALAGIWSLPAPEKVIGTITAVDTFLGVLLGISQKNFRKQVGLGTIHVTPTVKGTTYLIELDKDPEYEMDGKREVRLAVKKHIRQG